MLRAYSLGELVTKNKKKHRRKGKDDDGGGVGDESLGSFCLGASLLVCTYCGEEGHKRGVCSKLL